ncbi:MAG: hypothetical protein KBA28_05440 [Syntrophaceae bacterium]|jgi:hypothetical protein|nr:hypothetical protein [Syntrophaceae bacterium]
MKIAKEIHAVLCDDIRHEIGNKISLMGVYGKDILVPDIPYVLQKLCLWLSLKEPQVDLGALRIVITTPQNEPLVLNVPAPPPIQNEPQDIQIGIVIAPLNIKGEGQAKIEIFQGKKPITLISHPFNLIKTNSN